MTLGSRRVDSRDKRKMPALVVETPKLPYSIGRTDPRDWFALWIYVV